MAIDLIEHDEDSPFESLRVGNDFLSEGYSNLLGIGEGRSKRKKLERSIGTADDPNFVSNLNRLLDTFKTSDDRGNAQTVKSFLSSDSKLVQDSVKEYGMPTDSSKLWRLSMGIQFNKKWYLSPKASCEDLEILLGDVDDNITSEKEKLAAATTKSGKDAGREVLSMLNNFKTKVSNAYRTATCERQKADTQREAAIKENISIIQGVSAEQTARAEKQSKMTKYIIYGVGGLVLLAGVVILLKKN